MLKKICIIAILVLYSLPILSAEETTDTGIEQYDAVVILGKALNSDGTMLHELYERLYWGAKPYFEGKTGTIILTGSKNRGNADISEAEAMQNYLLEKGVSPSDIMLETRANTTVENALYTSQLIREKGIKSILLCSSPYHMNRSWDNPLKLFNKQLAGFAEVFPVSEFYAADHIKLIRGFDKNLETEVIPVKGRLINANLKKYIEQNKKSKNIFIYHYRGIFESSIVKQKYQKDIQYLHEVYQPF
ncbi:MAG: YdcF family protein [Spirochaetales bacterium]|nr:YdcF family protein [Spirochaetales bacterium]